jgi:hypothetical protein
VTHTREKRMQIEFWWRNLKDRENSENLGIGRG